MRLFTLLCLSSSLPMWAQWQLLESHTTADLRGIDYVGNGIAWASGTNGTILRTVDMGGHWQVCTTAPGAEQLDFRGIQAFNADTALVMSSGKGGLSRIYKTSDGCQSWKLVFTNPDRDGFWDAISIRHSNHDARGKPLDYSHAWGYLIGDPVGGSFSLFATSDGGDSWKRRVATNRGPKGVGCKMDDFAAKADEALFAASNESLLAMSGHYLVFATGGSITRIAYTDLFSPDAGFCHEFAHFLNLPLTHGTASSGAFAIAAGPENEELGNYPKNIVVVGGDYLGSNATIGNAAIVTQLGISVVQKVEAVTTPPHGYRSAVAYDKPSNTWITVGPNGTDISSNGGRDWQSIGPSGVESPDADKHWNALSLPFVVGPHGRIGKLRDNILSHAHSPMR